MDSQDSYYKKKLEQLQADENRKSANETQRQLVPLAIAGAVLLAIYFVLLFLFAPGVLVFTLLAEHLSLKVGYALIWVYSAAISSAVFISIFCLAKNAILTSKIYLAVCVVAAVTALAIPMHGSSTAFEQALLLYSPLNAFAKNPAPSKTNREPSAEANLAEPENTSTLASNEKVAQTPIGANSSERLIGEEDNSSIPTSEHYKKSENQEAAPISGPSFNCKKATLKSEKIICESPYLSSLDLQLSVAYQKRLDQTDDKKTLKAEQLDWILNSVRPCEDDECLGAAYTERFNELSE